MSNGKRLSQLSVRWKRGAQVMTMMMTMAMKKKSQSNETWKEITNTKLFMKTHAHGQCLLIYFISDKNKCKLSFVLIKVISLWWCGWCATRMVVCWWEFNSICGCVIWLVDRSEWETILVDIFRYSIAFVLVIVLVQLSFPPSIEPFGRHHFPVLRCFVSQSKNEMRIVRACVRL